MPANRPSPGSRVAKAVLNAAADTDATNTEVVAGLAMAIATVGMHAGFTRQQLLIRLEAAIEIVEMQQAAEQQLARAGGN